MNNIVVRTITGAVFISMVLFPLFYSDVLSTSVLGGFMLFALIEFYQLFSKSKYIEIRWEVGAIVGTVLYGLSSCIMYDIFPTSFSVIFVPFIFLFITMELWRKKKNPLLNAGILVLGLFYVTLPFLLMSSLNASDMNDFPLLAGMFILIWMNDTFAYLSGRFFGKTKLIERISPNKTWEGTVGGIVFTILGSIAIALLFDSSNLTFWIISALIISPCAIFGDLLESLFKRNVGVKDSGTLLPGHGGVLDRFDATLLTIPFFTLWTSIYLIL